VLHVKKFKVAEEREVGDYIFYLHMDKGRKFTSCEFDKLWKLDDIKKIIMIYTLQQSGITKKNLSYTLYYVKNG